MTKRKPTTDAAEILRQRYVKGDPDRISALERERLNAAVARQIYEARTSRKLSQAKLAAMIGTTQSVIARLEDADYDGHSLTMLRRIAEALGYEVEVQLVQRAIA